jgi:hypothetical protein
MFETTIAVETLLLQATNGDPKENLHNSAQVTSRFNLLDCFWKDVTGGRYCEVRTEREVSQTVLRKILGPLREDELEKAEQGDASDLHRPRDNGN